MATAKALQVLVKPHVKRISFPARSGVIPKWTGQTATVSAPVTPTPSSSLHPTPPPTRKYDTQCSFNFLNLFLYAL